MPPDLPPGVTDGRAPSARQPSAAEIRSLTLLRVLVTVLTATMIAGMVALIALLYLRLPSGATATDATLPLSLPEDLALPEGAVVQAVTAGPTWWAVVTQEGEILFYGADGRLIRRIDAPELAGPELAGPELSRPE